MSADTWVNLPEERNCFKVNKHSVSLPPLPGRRIKVIPKDAQSVSVSRQQSPANRVLKKFHIVEASQLKPKISFYLMAGKEIVCPNTTKISDYQHSPRLSEAFCNVLRKIGSEQLRIARTAPGRTLCEFLFFGFSTRRIHMFDADQWQ